MEDFQDLVPGYNYDKISLYAKSEFIAYDERFMYARFIYKTIKMSIVCLYNITIYNIVS